MAYHGKCYDKCYANARKGLIAFGDCAPPASDPTTIACLANVAAKAGYYIDHDCHAPPAIPDNCGGPYPTASEWVGYARIAAAGNVPATYCSSPSAAFLD